jgi:hypothetical protein
MAATAEEYEKKYQRILLSASIRQGATQNILPTHTNRFATIKWYLYDQWYRVQSVRVVELW